MRTRLRSSAGLSLVEATVIVMVLGVLTAVIAPAVGNYVEDARNVAAKGDTEAIGSAVLQLLRDTGSRCLRLAGTNDCSVTNRVDLLVSGGEDPDSVSAASITLPDSQAATGGGLVNWLPSPDAPAAGRQDTIDDQLLENDNATPYTMASFTAGGGPRMKLGWRGAYLTGPISSDPWGYKYQVNTIFLTVATNAFDTDPGPNQAQEGLREAGWHRDVLVLSPGSNGSVQTSFGGTATGGVTATGDDVVYVIKGDAMTRRLRGDAGLSLVEATVILMVLALLTAVAAPAIGVYAEEARQAKATADVQAIGSALDRLLRDTGLLCVSFNGSSCANTATGRVELLVSGTDVDANEPTVVTTAFAAGATIASNANLNWAGGASEVQSASRDLMDDQFVTNAPGYSSPSFTAGGGPRAALGWRGAYLNGPIDVDPWGYAYQASTVFLTPASDAADGTGTGQRRGGWSSDVVVLSAGSNGTVQTAFGANATAAAGDDVIYVFQGSTN